MLQDSKIDTTMNDLKETADKADRLKDDIKGDLANAQEDLMKKIRKASTILNEEAMVQDQRLVAFEKKILDSDITMHIPDHDMIFLQKEIARY